MARVTVEDCVVQIPNRFELVMLAAHRARSLASGAELTLERDRDKNPVVALREIAEQNLDLGSLEDSLIKGLQKRIEPEQPEEEVVELMAGEQQNWIGPIGDSDDEGAADEEASDEFADEDDGNDVAMDAENSDKNLEPATFEDAVDIKE